MNNVILIGRPTKDIEVRYAGETAITKFTLAVDRQGKEKQADFINIVCFGKTTELCERFLAKGKKVAIQGRIQTGSYENKDGKKVYTTDVIAERVEFLEWADKKDEIPSGFEEVEEYAALDEDLPF